MEKVILLLAFLASLVCVGFGFVRALNLQLGDKCAEARRFARDLFYVSINRGTVIGVYDLPKIDVSAREATLLRSEECGLSINIRRVCWESSGTTLPEGRARLVVSYSSAKDCVEVALAERPKN